MTFVVVAAVMLLPPYRRQQGQEEGYLLWELRVVKSGLKDAGGKDWKRGEETWEHEGSENVQIKLIRISHTVVSVLIGKGFYHSQHLDTVSFRGKKTVRRKWKTLVLKQH